MIIGTGAIGPLTIVGVLSLRDALGVAVEMAEPCNRPCRLVDAEPAVVGGCPRGGGTVAPSADGDAERRQ